ncbi:MAG: hypothetical protein ABIT07_13055 [Ferruginibacter sp.]
MKNSIFLVIALGLFLSCNSNERKHPQTALDTGRDFIRASLNGDFKNAELLILKDTQNLQLFESYKTFYSRLPADKKKNYKEASYNINKYQDVDDSTSIINYSNSFMNKPMEIKLVKINNLWGVDFKYTYSGN